jgi:hypothetical protein
VRQAVGPAQTIRFVLAGTPGRSIPTLIELFYTVKRRGTMTVMEAGSARQRGFNADSRHEGIIAYKTDITGVDIGVWVTVTTASQGRHAALTVRRLETGII